MSAGLFPTPPRHFSFFRNYGPSPLPPSIPTAGVDLSITDPPVARMCGVILVVLFGAVLNHFKVLVWASGTPRWEAATGALHRALVVQQGPSIVVGNNVYKLQSEEKYIMLINATKMTLAAVPLPKSRIILFIGNHWIGKTNAGQICFFVIRNQLVLARWILEAPGKWSE